jgi:beta-lactamase regulating signal transducer with metallopeptidase domain
MTTFWAEFFIVLAAEAALLIIATALVQRFVRSETWRRTIWQAAFVALAILLACEMNGARSTVKRMFASTETPSGMQPARSPAPSLRHAVATKSGASDKTSVPIPVVVDTAKPKIRIRGQWWPGLLWFGGVLALAGLAIIRRAFLARFRRHCRRADDVALLAQIEALARLLAVNHRVHIVTSDRLVSPIAFGVLRPTMCLPTNFRELFTPSEQEAVLLHELAHLAARDSIWLSMADAVLALFWWHPLVWWAQRQLRNTTEAAADESSVLLAEGPKVLAGCLVTLGTRFTDSAGFKALGIHGVRFRSGLGRRVQRLFALSNTRWSAPAVWRSRMTQFCAPTICAAAILSCGAWATTSKGQTMKSWKNSVAGLVAVSLLQTLQAEPGAKPSDALAAAASKPAKPGKSAPTLSTLSEIQETSKNAQATRSKLEKIVIESVAYDALPLGEVVRQLMVESAARDSDKRGVNFVFGYPRLNPVPVVDPATGLPMPGKSSPEVPDIRTTTIRIEPPLRNIRLIDLLEIIRRVADQPIEYTIHDYGVVFSAAPVPGSSIIPETVVPTVARTFKVDPNTFFPNVKNTFGIEIRTRSAEDMRSGLAQFLATLGVDIYAPNRAVFYNQSNGILLVRASEDEMVLINAAMETIGAAPAGPK